MVDVEKKNGGVIGAVTYFMRCYPKQTAIMLVALVLAGLSEAVSFAALLPVLQLAVGGALEAGGGIGEFIQQIVRAVGLEPTIGALLFLVSVLIFAKAILMFFAMKNVGYTAARVSADFRSQILQALMQSKWEYFSGKKTGELTAALGNEPERAALVYIAFGNIMASVALIGAYSYVAFSISVSVTLSAFVVGPLAMLLLAGLVRMARAAGENQTKAQKSFMTNVIEGLNSMKSIKAMSKESQFSRLYDSDIALLLNARRKSIFSSVGLNYCQEPILVGIICAGLFLYVGQWGGGFEQLVVIVLLFYRSVRQLHMLQKYYQQIVSALPAFWFLQSLKDGASARREDFEGGAIPEYNSTIQLKNIGFSYGKKQILNGLDLAIEKGRFVALIGGSGGGKTTTADLIIGLHKPAEGSILIDGVDLTTIDISRWRSMIGYVPQETILFHDSIFKNISLGDDSITLDDAWNALEQAGAAEFVKCLDGGIDSLVGEHGLKISGGQRQRISIARALVRKPQILILDEATTALDPETESAVLETLRLLVGQVSIFAISHQEAVKYAADAVYELIDGKAVLVENLEKVS